MGLIGFRARRRRGAEHQERTGSLPRELHAHPLCPVCCGKRPALRPGPPAGGFSNEKLSKLPRVSSCSKGEWMCTNTPKGTSEFLESAGPRSPPPNTYTHTHGVPRPSPPGRGGLLPRQRLTSRAPRTTNRGLHSAMQTGYVSHREAKSNVEATRDRT